MRKFIQKKSQILSKEKLQKAIKRDREHIKKCQHLDPSKGNAYFTDNFLESMLENIEDHHQSNNKNSKGK